MKPNVFKTYDIRGLYGSEISVEDAVTIGRAFGALNKRMTIGYDVRLFSPLLAAAATAGALESGSEVTDTGLVSTPQLCFSALLLKAPGLGVSASHNPKEYCGFKFQRADGTAYHPTELKKIYSAIKITKKGGATGTYIKRDTYQEYVENITSRIVPAGKKKIAVDLSNGAGGAIVDVLKTLGHTVLTINEKPDGNFPAHAPEPTEETMGALQALVKREKCDFGVALDGDADRSVFVDRDGVIIRGDEMLAVFAKHELQKRKGKVVATINLSERLREVVTEAGGKFQWIEIGRSYIDSAMPAVVAGEESCHFWFGDFYNFSDGILATAKATEVGDLTSEVRELGFGKVTRVNFPCPDKKKELVLNKLKTLWKKDGEINTLDGLRLTTSKGWLIIRKSNTEPLLRLTAEMPESVSTKYIKTIHGLI